MFYKTGTRCLLRESIPLATKVSRIFVSRAASERLKLIDHRVRRYPAPSREYLLPLYAFAITSRKNNTALISCLGIRRPMRPRLSVSKEVDRFDVRVRVLVLCSRATESIVNVNNEDIEILPR